jgi:hypothetical protein
LDKDRLINLLPEEYLPEPEFKAFPIFAAGLVIITLLLIFIQYKTDDATARGLNDKVKALTTDNAARVERVKEFTEVQANARFISSYVAVIPNMVLQAPDYWEIYNEIERLLPEDTWVKGITFRGGGKNWPEIALDCVSRGYSYNGPLLTYDQMKGSPESPTRFNNIRMAGYRRIMLAGSPGVTFQILMGIQYPTEENTRKE